MPEITDEMINAACAAYEYATTDESPSWRGMRAALLRVAPLITAQERIGPSYHEQLAKAEAVTLTMARRTHAAEEALHAAEEALEQTRAELGAANRDLDHARRERDAARAELAHWQPVTAAARTWREAARAGDDPALWADGSDMALIAAVDALGQDAAGRPGSGPRAPLPAETAAGPPAHTDPRAEPRSAGSGDHSARTEAPDGGPWTRHGHPIAGITVIGRWRPSITRCGGPALCGQCRDDEQQIRRETTGADHG